MKDLLNPFTAVCTVGFFARMGYAMARTPVLPLFALSLGASPGTIGLIAAASTITGIFFKLPAGAISDIYGRKPTFLVGIFIFAVTPFTYLLVEDYWGLMGVRFFHGLATAIYGPVAMSMVIDFAGKKRGEHLSLFSSITIIGNLLGAPLGGYMLYHFARGGSPAVADFHRTYLVSGCFGILSLLFTLKLIGFKANPSESPSTNKDLRVAFRRFYEGIKEVISEKRILITSNMQGMQKLSVGALEAFLPVYVVTVAGLNEFCAGMLWGIQVGSAIIAKPLMGRISDKYGRRPLIVSGVLICALPLALIPFTKSFPALLALAMLFGLGEALLTSSAAALVADMCKAQSHGAAMGIFGTIFDMGHATGPVLAGILLGYFNYAVAFGVISVILFLTPIPFLIFVPPYSEYDVGKA